LHERPVGCEGLAVVDAHGGGRRRVVHLLSGRHSGGAGERLVVGEVPLLLVLRQPCPGLRVARGGRVALVDEHDVFHRFLLGVDGRLIDEREGRKSTARRQAGETTSGSGGSAYSRATWSTRRSSTARWFT